MLFDLDGLGRRLFLPPGLGRLRNEGRPRPRLGFEWGIQLEPLFDGLSLEGETGLGPGLVSGLYKSRSRGLHSQCIRSFSIIGGPWL